MFYSAPAKNNGIKARVNFALVPALCNARIVKVCVQNNTMIKIQALSRQEQRKLCSCAADNRFHRTRYFEFVARDVLKTFVVPLRHAQELDLMLPRQNGIVIDLVMKESMEDGRVVKPEA